MGSQCLLVQPPHGPPYVHPCCRVLPAVENQLILQWDPVYPMQQQITQQHDQIGGPQTMSQQMVLCPVRFVYETQILVQPGDHIQPNQTFFINAQNPPPWMQNSFQTRHAITNPAVVYVQQLPNNIVSTVQQPMDQTQLYLQQNLANYQIQQQMLAQNQDMRPTMQLANIVPNMVQNVQNIQTNVANDRSAHQNAQMQANTQIVPVNRPIQNQMNQMEVQRQVVMRPQMQQTNIQRPMMSINQMQNMQQQTAPVPNIPQNVNHMPNIGRPSVNMNVVRTSVPNNTVNAQSIAKVRDTTPSEITKNVNHNPNSVPNLRNFVPNYYRPIQPRPQTSQNIANIPKPQHIPVQTVQSTPVYNHDRYISHQNTNNYITVQQINNPANRKRKSESPDEIHKKIIVNTKSNQQQSMTITKIVNEIGTNTSPIHKPRVNTQYKMNTNADSIIENIIKDAMIPLPEKDKLIRNTVYTQARGRLLQDKIEEVKLQNEITIVPVNVLENRVLETVKMDVKEESRAMDVDKSVQTVSEVDKIVNKNVFIETTPIIIKEEAKVTEIIENKEIHSVNIDTEMKLSDMKQNINDKEDTKHVQIVVSYIKDGETGEDIKQADRCETETTVEIISNGDDGNNNKEETCNNENAESNNKVIKQENINILTHVLDGYVIQESNYAFPIRKPLKEKTLRTNLKTCGSEEKDLVRESIKEELKNNLDIPLLPFHYLMLDNAQEETEKLEEVETVEDTSEDNPFSQLQHSTVKEWTVNDICNHLLKYNWKETVSLFNEHEIDGESLLLVSKQQLITIGVKEDHADIICEFLKG